MKKIILSACIMLTIGIYAQTITDTISTGKSYKNQIWYSLQNDEVGSQSKDTWDLAIELSGFNSSILVNTQKTGTAVYQTPYNWSEWNQFDTTGYKQWTSLYNSDSMWDIGALNQTGEYNTSDLGWGTYDNTTHVIAGTRLYLITLPGNKFIKLGVKSLANGIYTITYANTDKSDSTTFTVTKADYVKKNFVYYAFDTKAINDREPDNTAWDLTFTKYIYNRYPAGGGTFIPYPVTGILQNKGVKVAEVRKTYIPTTNNYSSQTFTSKISEIGSDWKTFNFNTNSYAITDSLVYFVQDIDKNIWKLVMTGFSGTGQGNYILNKEKLGNLSVTSIDANNHIYVYPNPVAQGQSVTLITDFNNDFNPSRLSITDMNGKLLFEDSNPVKNGLGALEIPFSFEKGIYFVSILTAEGKITQKLLSF